MFAISDDDSRFVQGVELRSRIGSLKDAILLLSMLALGLLIAAKLNDRETGEYRGPLFAIDGDTLEAGGERLRLAGLDAPELSQSCSRRNVAWDCGRQAQRLLEELADDATLVCVASRRDRYDRPLVRCGGKGGDIGALIVASGLAIADGAYGAEQRDARERRLGLWAGDFTPPAEWRAARRNEDRSLWFSELVGWFLGLLGREG